MTWKGRVLSGLRSTALPVWLALLVNLACARSPIALPTTAQSASSVTDVLVPIGASARDSASFARFRPDLPPPSGPFVCTSWERMSANVRSVSAAYPTAEASRATVVVSLDSTGKLVRYAEHRGPPIRPTITPEMSASQTAAAVAAAANVVRSTTVTLDYGRGVATIANRGGGRPTESVSARLAAVSLDVFGKPLDRAASVLAQCDHGPGS